jgi:hypothetical protein
MKKLIGVLLGTLFLCASLGVVAAAQESAEGVHAPPKILVVFREYLKPGRAGAAHEKTEKPFVQALTRAKSSGHYFAADSLSGRPRTLFFSGYDSFADWEKEHESMMKNPALSAELDRYSMADGDLLSDSDQTVLMFNEEQSLNPSVDIPHMRGFEITGFHVKPGHGKEWDELVKLVKAAYSKIPDVHWATFHMLYGGDGGTYIVFMPFKSGADLDKEDDQDKQFVAAMGEDGMKKLAELESSAVERTGSNLFVFNPGMSYPPDAWVKADPDFWKPKAAKPAAPKKPAEKPATNQ